MNYYNDTDPKVCAWAKELIKAKLVPDGEVDCRSIEDVRPDEIKDFVQCHFFCGILGWSLALRLAGWPDDRPVWTGSCPCQPFSAAGKGLAQADERHLWPVFFDLIRQCRPEHVFGEQVASAIGHGWIDGISADLEAEGYACGAAVLGAHSVQSPHQRQRLYWVADDRSGRREVAHLHGGGSGAPGSERASNLLGVCSASDTGAQTRRLDDTLVRCRDGKTRRIPTEPAFFPLAHGVPARVVRLRGYGNAIVPECAKIFIEAFLDIQK